MFLNKFSHRRGQFGLVNFLVWLILFLVLYAFLPFINDSIGIMDNYSNIPTTLKFIYSLSAATLIFAIVWTPISFLKNGGGSQ